MTDITHIYFDLDHTLWDFRTNSIATLKELFAQFDLGNKSGGIPEERFVDRYIYHNDRMWDLYRQDRIGKSRLRRARFELALADIQIHDKRLARELDVVYVETCPRKKALNMHAVEVLELLSRSFTLHILTNGFEETQRTKLEVSGLTRYFKEVITSEMAQARKPDRKMFAFAEKLTGSHKKYSLMIGDNLEIDIKGAIGFGWRAIHYNEEGIEHDFCSVRKLNELPGLLLK